MLKTIREQSGDTIRDPRRERELCHDALRGTSCLGCAACPDRIVCGGLSIKGPVFDCLAFCGGRPNDCDTVCRNHAEFTDRVREVGTFALETINRTAALPVPALPAVIPMLFHGAREKGRLRRPRWHFHSTACLTDGRAPPVRQS